MSTHQSSPSTVAQMRKSLQERDPFCIGTYTIPEYQRMLYYTQGDQLRRVDFSTAGPDELGALYRACKPAEFGRGGETLLDPSYRKAGKMDLNEFSTLFDPGSLGIHEQVSKALLLRTHSTMEMQLYKLNVYGEGDFFKAHKDTPRSQVMFGSLVVVLPTAHEGGQFVLRQAGTEWTVDLAPGTAAATEPSVRFVAFYGDLEHEVLPVTSGYRVTLTYNLYQKSPYSGTSPPSSLLPSSTQTPFHLQMKRALIDVVNDPSVLPRGGYLGFGLAHEYPYTGYDLLRPLPGLLKGSDRALADVCDALGLSYIFRLFYRDLDDRNISLITTRKLEVEEWGVQDQCRREYVDEVLRRLTTNQVQVVVVDGKYPSEVDMDRSFGRSMTEVLEVTPMESSVEVESTLLLYGNEASLDYFYGMACMLVPLEPAAMRHLNVAK